MDGTQQRFAGIRRLYGLTDAERIASAHICIVGLGGVGSWTAEALARTGVGHLTLVDLDEICITNTNRQIHALTNTVGHSKITTMAKRIQQIHPDCQVHTEHEFLTQDNAESLLSRPFDVVVDAIDSAHHKSVLLATAKALGRPVVTVGGAGGRRDPSRWAVDDLNSSCCDALLTRVRKTLRQKYAFPRGKSPWGIRCVYTTEEPVFPVPDGEICATTKPASPLRLDCTEGFGASTAVTGTAGFLAAATAIEVLLESKRC